MSYIPTWREYEEDLHSDNVDTAIAGADAFEKERIKETTKSKKARQWEEDRKKEAQRLKPQWVKQRRLEEENKDPAKKIINEIRDGGNVNYDVKPARGYLLIDLIDEEEVRGGIIIAKTEASEPNKAKVVEVGPALVYPDNTIHPPVKKGATILFKKFAGMDLDVKGKSLRMITFDDVLAELI